MRNLFFGLLLCTIMGGLIVILSGSPARAFAPALPEAAHGPVRAMQRASPAPITTAVPLPSATPTATPPPTASPTPLPYLPGDPAPQLAGELVMRTYSLDFYRLPASLDAETIRAMAMPIEESIAVTSAKIGLPWISGRVAVRFEPAQTGICAIRGLTMSHERTIRLFYDPGSDPQRIVSLMAHELFHQLQHDYYGWPQHRRSDVILLEGMATWGSSDYFRDQFGRPLYQTRVREALEAGNLLPLTTSLEADCRTTTRVNIYHQWASFVEFLYGNYGREALDAVYSRSNGRAPGSADYRGVYGKTLAELEAEWLLWLRSPALQPQP
jgi:hypothetical protein